MTDESAEQATPQQAPAPEEPIVVPPAVGPLPELPQPSDRQELPDAPEVLEDRSAETPPEHEAQDVVPMPEAADESPAADADADAETTHPEDPEPQAAPVAAAPAPEDLAPAWPFIAEGAVWVAFAAALVWVLLGTPAGTPTYEAELYPAFLLGGIALTAAGPLVILLVWLSTMGKARNKGHLFISALYRGAVATMSGVVIWWVALLVIDQIRLGRVF